MFAACSPKSSARRSPVHWREQLWVRCTGWRFEHEGADFVDIERLWVEEVGPGEFRVENVPFLCRGISQGDIVSGTFDADEMLSFVQVVRRSGNSVVRFACDAAIDDVLQALTSLGCRFERGGAGLYSLDVPMTVAWESVRPLLDEAERRGCTVEEANVSDAHAPGAADREA